MTDDIVYTLYRYTPLPRINFACTPEHLEELKQKLEGAKECNLPGVQFMEEQIAFLENYLAEKPEAAIAAEPPKPLEPGWRFTPDHGLVGPDAGDDHG